SSMMDWHPLSTRKTLTSCPGSVDHYRNESIRLLEDRLLAEPLSDEPDRADNLKPSHFLAISALLELLKEPVKHPRPNGLNQAAVIESILARFEFRGLGKRTLEEIFSVSNKVMKSST
ncbi:hypothetical protein RA263_22890, partial [Pseudomonas syringae pv. tagetis]